MKYLSIILIGTILVAGSRYEGSTAAAVALSGGVIKTTHIDPASKKYKRKDCPVCKGTGKYLSGDSIKMVDCGYCEPETQIEESQVIHPPVILSPSPPNTCNGPSCRLKQRSVLKK